MSVYLQDPDVTILHGDALELLRGLPSGSVHMACTSPPFYGLRDYGTGRWEGGQPDCDHLQKIGGTGASTLGEASGGHAISDEARKRSTTRSFVSYRDSCGKCGATRVDQQIGLENTPDEWVARLVDVFREVRRVLRDDGSLWVEIGDSYNSATQFNGQPKTNYAEADAGEWAGHRPLVAGIKPKDLIGAPWLLAFALRADGWYLRSEIIWAKPNPMPESVSDRPTVSHSRVFLLTKQARYFYDAEAIREPYNPDSLSRYDTPKANTGKQIGGRQPNGHWEHDPVMMSPNPAGRNRRSVWTIATQPYPEAHFATWPTRLVEPMILAGCPEGGTVLDPFGGAGTTAVAARKLGRKAILLELNPEYCALAAKRLAQQSLFANA